MSIKKNARVNLKKNGFLCLAFIFLFLLLPSGVGYAGQEAVITASDVHVRSGPGTGYRIIGMVNSGDTFPVLDKSGGWYKLQLSRGPGWVAGWLLQEKRSSGKSGASVGKSGAGAAPETGLAAVLTADDVHVRSGPGTGYRIIGMVNSGDTFPVLDKSGGWYKLQLSRGPGWVAGWLLRVTESSTLQGNNPSRGDTRNPDGAEKDGGDGGNSEDTESGDAENTGDAGSEEGNNKGTGSEGNIEGTGSEEGNNKGTGSNNNSESRNDINNSEDGARDGGQEKKNFLELKLEQKKDRTEIVLTSLNKFTSEIFSLSKPDRLVMDLKFDNLGDAAYAQPPSSVDIDKGPIERLRSSWLDDDRTVLRIVFDLKQRVHYNINVYNGGKTAVLEVFVPDFQKYLKGKKIFIDPGHGGCDPGAIGPSGLEEKEVTLDIAKRAAELLEDQGARVKLSRRRDSFVGLQERAEMANRFGAEIFISVHINANRNNGKHGISTYYYSPPEDSPARARDRRYLAWNIQNELSSALKRQNLGLYQAKFVVLRYTVMPAVLLEVGFISNHEEEELLKKRSFRERAAQALARGIGYYYAGKN